MCLAPLLKLSAGVASWVAPAALLTGVAFALTLGNPFHDQTKVLTKRLLQASVVLLGFSMDLGKVAAAGRSGILFSFVSIAMIFGFGWLLQRVLTIRPITGLLVSAGTAICGGSAIAAMSTVVDAREEDVSVSVGTVFLLNALALLIFPPLGHLLGLSQHQFGFWSGIAIHDIASVVGAGASYGPEALDVGTAVKLSRVLYLVPVTFLASTIYQRRSQKERGKPQIPWFVFLFLLASLARGITPLIAHYTGDIKRIASAGFALSLFLIGAALTRSALRSVGIRPLILGIVLWVSISIASLIVVLNG
jgi:uncharacterized integral membrane protein (TIGR00698 family)